MALSLADILRLLSASSGEDLEFDVVSPGDVAFALLGYDSLTVLKTVADIERTCRIELPENVVGTVRTPRDLLELVNAQLPLDSSRMDVR
jgi:act minimal PKS acyl carrier protein